MHIVTSRGNGSTTYAKITKKIAPDIIVSREDYLQEFGRVLTPSEIDECKREIAEARRVLKM